MKKICLIFTIISIIGLIFSTVFGTNYKPLSFTQTLELIAESDLSFDRAYTTIQEMQVYAEKIGDIDTLKDMESSESEDEKGFLRQLVNICTTFFNYVIDFFVMLGYTIKLILLFVVDALESIITILGLIFKIIGFSPTT